MMYSVYSKKELAHDEGIWSCAWGRYTPEKKKKDQENNADENDEKSRDSVSSEDAPVDFLITGAMDDLVKVWDLNQDKLELKHTLEGHSLGILSVAASNNGKLCASSSLDSSLRIWDLEKGEQISSMDVGPMDLWTVAFSPDDKFIIFGNQSGEISQYNIAENMKTEQTFETRGKFILSLAYSPDGKYIASGAIDGIINIFDVVSNKLMHTLEGHAMPIRSLCFSPNSQFLLTGSDDGHMKLYDVQDTHVIGTMSGHASWVLEVDFSPDGMNFVSSSSDKTVKVWEVQSRQCVHTFNEHADQVWGVKYSPDNNKIMSVSEDKNLIIYSCPKL